MHSPLSSCDSVWRSMALRTDTALEVRSDLYDRGNISRLKEFYIRRLSQNDGVAPAMARLRQSRSPRSNFGSPRTNSEVESPESIYEKYVTGKVLLSSSLGRLSKVAPRIEMLNAKLISLRAALESRILDGSSQSNVLRHLTQLRYHLDSALKWGPDAADLGAISEHTIQQVQQLASTARVLAPGVYLFSKRAENILIQKERALKKAAQVLFEDQRKSYNSATWHEELATVAEATAGLQRRHENPDLKAESTVVSELDSECGTMYADTVITCPADVGNVQDVNDYLALKSEDQQRRWFYSQCLAAKLVTSDQARARKILISDLYAKVKASGIPITNWMMFIQEQLMLGRGIPVPTDIR
ncbi:unnamed protein product [Cladocopium goreaui]|uniref:Uncharacterized protein n=1 Tax=Cladocopium goreaui TaxID=2562237 RepID=A0A9P1GET4_9DINO|nr:unnamed protein product [Cladocopium goreaui]